MPRRPGMNGDTWALERGLQGRTGVWECCPGAGRARGGREGFAMIDRREVFGMAAAGVALPALVRAQGAPQFTFRLHSFSSPTALDHTMHLDRWAERDRRGIGRAHQGRGLSGHAARRAAARPGAAARRRRGRHDLDRAGLHAGPLHGRRGAGAALHEHRPVGDREPGGLRLRRRSTWPTTSSAASRSSPSTPPTARWCTPRASRSARWRIGAGMRIRVAGRWIGEAVTALGAHAGRHRRCPASTRRWRAARSTA